MEEEKIKIIQDAIFDLEWNDEVIVEIMEGFYNSPSEVLDIDKCSEEHLESLWELLDLYEK